MILAGDVGGTKIYLARFEIEGDLPSEPMAEELLLGANYPSLEALVGDYVARNPGTVEAACFGVAGAVVDSSVISTNLPWKVESVSVARALGLDEVHLINDLVATGYGIAALRPGELEPLQEMDPAGDANAGLLAAGTGLGESILVRAGEEFLPIPSEAGHADFAPRTDEELRVFRAFRDRYGRVSYERILSGPGLAALGEFFHAERGASEVWGKHLKTVGETGPAEVVTRFGIERSCPGCEDALLLFVGVFGAEAGNMALRAVARGGIYLGGGIAPRIVQALKWGNFLEAFRHKEPHLRPLLSSIPVWVIRNERTGLLGAARYAAIAEG